MSSSLLAGVFSPGQKSTEPCSPLSAQASCSSQFPSSAAHGWEKSKCHYVHPKPAAWAAFLVIPFLPITRHRSSRLRTRLPFTFSSHFRQTCPKTDLISPGTEPAQGGGITPLSIPHTASLESSAHLPPFHKHLAESSLLSTCCGQC